jgi:hypothetical protein
MTTPGLILAQQMLNWFDVIRDALWELYLWFIQFVRTGRVVWVLVIVAAIIMYQRFKKK